MSRRDYRGNDPYRRCRSIRDAVLCRAFRRNLDGVLEGRSTILWTARTACSDFSAPLFAQEFLSGSGLFALPAPIIPQSHSEGNIVVSDF